MRQGLTRVIGPTWRMKPGRTKSIPFMEQNRIQVNSDLQVINCFFCTKLLRQRVFSCSVTRVYFLKGGL